MLSSELTGLGMEGEFWQMFFVHLGTKLSYHWIQVSVTNQSFKIISPLVQAFQVLTDIL